MTVSRLPRCAWRPCASFAPPTPPARTTTRDGPSATDADAAEQLGQLRHPLDRLVVVRPGQPRDERREAQVRIRPEAVGEELRAAEERRGVERVRAVRSEDLQVGRLGVGRRIADDDREAEGQLDLAEVPADVRAVAAEDLDPLANLLDRPGR